MLGYPFDGPDAERVAAHVINDTRPGGKLYVTCERVSQDFGPDINFNLANLNFSGDGPLPVAQFTDQAGALLGKLTFYAAGGTHTEFFDPNSSELWNYRAVDRNEDQQVIADIRDYADLHFNLLANHALPQDLWRMDEPVATGASAAFASAQVHGGGIEQAAPNPIAFERGVDIFSFGSFDIDPVYQGNFASVRLDAPRDLAASFDTSGWFYYNGDSSWGVGARFPVPTSLFDRSFGGIDFFEPVILDLDGNGVRIEPRTDSSVFFNADGDIALERTAWVGAGDGLLVVDLDGDGKITQANEIAFADRTADPNDTDLEALGTLYDSNGDHQITSADAQWNDLRVWEDANRNGKTDANELRTLGQRGITSISLASDHNAFSLPDASRINGFSTFVMNGATRALADAAISFQTTGFTRTTDADGYYYSSDDNATRRYYLDMKIAYGGSSYEVDPGSPDAVGFDSTISLSTNPLVIYDGVLGSKRPDKLVFVANHPLTLYGDAGNDLLQSNNFYNDVLDGGPGADILLAGVGDDTLFMDQFDTTVNGGPGYDTGILTSPGSFTIALASKGLEAFISNNGNDTITANPAAAGYIDGRGGNDKIYGGGAGDMLVGGTGSDEVYGGGGNDMLVGGADHDKLYGDAGEDVLIGGIGSDTIDGGSDADTATFTGAAADYTMAAYNGHIYVRAANGDRDDVTGVEFLRFDDRTIDPNSVQQLGAINPLEYVASYSDLIAGREPRTCADNAEGVFQQGFRAVWPHNQRARKFYNL